MIKWVHLCAGGRTSGASNDAAFDIIVSLRRQRGRLVPIWLAAVSPGDGKSRGGLPHGVGSPTPRGCSISAQRRAPRMGLAPRGPWGRVLSSDLDAYPSLGESLVDCPKGRQSFRRDAAASPLTVYSVRTASQQFNPRSGHFWYGQCDWPHDYLS